MYNVIDLMQSKLNDKGKLLHYAIADRDKQLKKRISRPSIVKATTRHVRSNEAFRAPAIARGCLEAIKWPYEPALTWEPHMWLIWG